MRGLAGLIVQFFTRPLKLSDFNVARLFKQRAAVPSSSFVDEEGFAPTRLVERADVMDVWGRSLAADVSEQPAHTLPAELQEELGLKRSNPSLPE